MNKVWLTKSLPGFFDLLSSDSSLIPLFHCLMCGSIFRRSQHVLWTAGSVFLGFVLFASMTLFSTLEIIILTLRTFPSTIREFVGVGGSRRSLGQACAVWFLWLCITCHDCLLLNILSLNLILHLFPLFHRVFLIFVLLILLELRKQVLWKNRSVFGVLVCLIMLVEILVDLTIGLRERYLFGVKSLLDALVATWAGRSAGVTRKVLLGGAIRVWLICFRKGVSSQATSWWGRISRRKVILIIR